MRTTKKAIAAANTAAKQMQADPDFQDVFVHTAAGGTSPNCGIWLRDGRSIDALVTAFDVLGNVTVVLPDGGTRQYLADEVA